MEYLLFLEILWVAYDSARWFDFSYLLMNNKLHTAQWPKTHLP